jgi:hypothetical protein
MSKNFYNDNLGVLNSENFIKDFEKYDNHYYTLYSSTGSNVADNIKKGYTILNKTGNERYTLPVVLLFTFGTNGTKFYVAGPGITSVSITNLLKNYAKIDNQGTGSKFCGFFAGTTARLIIKTKTDVGAVGGCIKLSPTTFLYTTTYPYINSKISEISGNNMYDNFTDITWEDSVTMTDFLNQRLSIATRSLPIPSINKRYYGNQTVDLLTGNTTQYYGLGAPIAAGTYTFDYKDSIYKYLLSTILTSTRTYIGLDVSNNLLYNGTSPIPQEDERYILPTVLLFLKTDVYNNATFTFFSIYDKNVALASYCIDIQDVITKYTNRYGEFIGILPGTNKTIGVYTTYPFVSGGIFGDYKYKTDYSNYNNANNGTSYMYYNSSRQPLVMANLGKYINGIYIDRTKQPMDTVKKLFMEYVDYLKTYQQGLMGIRTIDAYNTLLSCGTGASCYSPYAAENMPLLESYTSLSDQTANANTTNKTNTNNTMENIFRSIDITKLKKRYDESKYRKILLLITNIVLIFILVILIIYLCFHKHARNQKRSDEDAYQKVF